MNVLTMTTDIWHETKNEWYVGVTDHMLVTGSGSMNINL